MVGGQFCATQQETCDAVTTTAEAKVGDVCFPSGGIDVSRRVRACAVNKKRRGSGTAVNSVTSPSAGYATLAQYVRDVSLPTAAGRMNASIFSWATLGFAAAAG